MLLDLRYFDSTAISDLRIPLPVSRTEDLVFYKNNVYFKFKEKYSEEMVESKSGCLYLTDLRLIYIPDSAVGFTTFYIPLTKLFAVNNSKFLECLCEDAYIGLLFLSFQDSQNDFYFSEIKKVVDKTVMVLDEDDPSDLPYYSDICEN